MGLEQATLVVEENLSDMEFGLQPCSWRREILQNGEVTVTDDLHAVLGDELSREQCDRLKQHLGVTKAAVVPFVMEGEAFGVGVFLFAGNEPDPELLEVVSAHCTLALKDPLALEETTRFGGIDPVTWAHSRGYFLTALDSEVVRARRYGRDLSVIFFDIDEFGQFNADYGHSTGDMLLRAVAMTLASAIGLPELVARYGGDEFVVLLPESSRAEAAQLTATIVDKLQNTSPFGEGAQEPLKVSASAAIVSYPEEGANREELLRSFARAGKTRAPAIQPIPSESYAGAIAASRRPSPRSLTLLPACLLNGFTPPRPIVLIGTVFNPSREVITCF